MTKLSIALALLATACGGLVTPSENSAPARVEGTAAPVPAAAQDFAPLSNSALPVAGPPRSRSDASIDAAASDSDVVNPNLPTSAANAQVLDAGILAEPLDASSVDVIVAPDAMLASNEQDAQAPDAGVANDLPAIPWCAPHPTTFVSIVANLDPNATIPVNDWSTTFSNQTYTPASASNFSSTITIYDSAGMARTLDTYFRNAGPGRWQYHSISGTDGVTLVEVGSGLLEFGMDGALSHREILQPLRLPQPNGTWGPEILHMMGTPTDEGGTGTDGLTNYAGPSNVSMQASNGNSGTLGVACPESAQAPANALNVDAGTDPLIILPSDREPTSRFTIRTNLYAQATPHTEWDSTHPTETSNLAAELFADDQQARMATLGLYFQKLGEGTWRYHVLLEGDVKGLELATGELHFNQDGSLREVKTLRTLVLPNVDDHLNRPIDLDFGAPTASGGNGIDGVTSFATSSHAVDPPQYGTTHFVGPRPASCIAQLTTFVDVGGNLSADASIVTHPWSRDNPAGTSSVSFFVTLVDTFGQPVNLTLYFIRRAQLTWEYHAITANSESSLDLGSGMIQFAANGLQLQLDVLSPFRMLQSDGSRGPWVNLDFGNTSSSIWYAHNFSSFTSASYSLLYTDGHVALNTECTD